MDSENIRTATKMLPLRDLSNVLFHPRGPTKPCKIKNNKAPYSRSHPYKVSVKIDPTPVEDKNGVLVYKDSPRDPKSGALAVLSLTKVSNLGDKESVLLCRQKKNTRQQVSPRNLFSSSSPGTLRGLSESVKLWVVSTIRTSWPLYRLEPWGLQASQCWSSVPKAVWLPTLENYSSQTSFVTLSKLPTLCSTFTIVTCSIRIWDRKISLSMNMTIQWLLISVCLTLYHQGRVAVRPEEHQEVVMCSIKDTTEPEWVHSLYLYSIYSWVYLSMSLNNSHMSNPIPPFAVVVYLFCYSCYDF